MVLSDEEPRSRVKLPGDSVVKLTLQLGGPTAAAASSPKYQADYQPSAGSSPEDDESFSPASQSTSLPKPRGRPSKLSGSPLTKEERELKKLGVAQRREKREMARREKAWREMEEAEKNEEESGEEDGSEEEEEAYGGILGEGGREVGERKVEEDDRSRWERARDQAEQNALRDFALSVASPSTPSATLPESLTPLPLDPSTLTPFSPHSLSLALLHRPTRASFSQLTTQSSSSVLETQIQPPTPLSELFQNISARTALTPDDIYFIFTKRHIITDFSSVPSPPSVSLPSASDSASGLGRTSTPSRGGNQWSSRKRSSQMASATLAGSSSSRPHNEDPHSTPAVVIPKAYRIHWDAEVRAHVEKYKAKEYLQLKPERLQWSLFLVTRYGVEPPPPAPEMTAEISNDGGGKPGPSSGELTGSVKLVGPEKSWTPAATFVPSPHVNGTHSPQVLDREEASEPEEPVSDEEVDVVEEAEYEEPAKTRSQITTKKMRRRKRPDFDCGSKEDNRDGRG
ncbi:hypothetical protein P7C70_g8091, partial [Phenoliferia sp. Uapishka_3]